MHRLLALGSLSLLLLAAGPAAATDSSSSDWGDGYPSDLYPTDRCAAAKLYASANYCRAAIRAWDRGDPSVEADERLLNARARLAQRWMEAEDVSQAAGVSCAETTATADETIALLDAGAAELAASIATSEGSPGKGHGGHWRPWGRWYDFLDWLRWRNGDDDALRGWDHGDEHDSDTHGRPDRREENEQKCESRRNQLAAQACRQLLRNNGKHLVYRAHDREREYLDWSDRVVNRHLEKQWSHGAAKVCEGGPTGEEAVEQVGAVVDAALYAGLVSPDVSQEWTMVTPDEQVEYLGKTLEPICSTGTPWVFFVKRGTVNKTLVYYQGGGACWDYLTCSLPTHKVTTGPSDDPSDADSGFADLSNPDNPYKDWNIVFVPYCTGDVHWGDEVVEHTRGNRSITIYHRGYVNAQVAEKWAREHFVNPDDVFVTGSSAGAYGAIVNSLPLQEYTLAVLGLRRARRRRRRRHHPGVPGERHLQVGRREEPARLDPGLERPADGAHRRRPVDRVGALLPVQPLRQLHDRLRRRPGRPGRLLQRHAERTRSGAGCAGGRRAASGTDQCADWSQDTASKVPKLPLLHRHRLATHDVGQRQGLHRHDGQRPDDRRAGSGACSTRRRPGPTSSATTAALLLPGDPRPSPAVEPYTPEGTIVCEDEPEE